MDSLNENLTLATASEVRRVISTQKMATERLTAGDPARGEDGTAAGRHPIPARRLRGRVPRGGDEAGQVQDTLPGSKRSYTTAGHVFKLLCRPRSGRTRSS